MRKYSAYAADMIAIADEAREQYAAIIKARDDAIEKEKRTAARYNPGDPIGDRRRQITRLEREEAEQLYPKQVDALRDETMRKYKALRAELSDDIDEFILVDPAKVDPAGVALIQSGTLSDADYQHLAKKYSTNPTMLRLISGEVQKMGLDKSRIARALAYTIDEFTSKEKRLAFFDDNVEALMKTIRREEYMSAGIAKLMDASGYQNIKDSAKRFDDYCNMMGIVKVVKDGQDEQGDRPGA